MQATKEKESLPLKYQVVADLLGEGKENAITADKIAMFAGINGSRAKRDVTEIIERLVIKYGYAIGTSRRGAYRGYFLIVTDDELKGTLFTYNQQIQSMLNRHRALQQNYINKDQSEM